MPQIWNDRIYYDIVGQEINISVTVIVIFMNSTFYYKYEFDIGDRF